MENTITKITRTALNKGYAIAAFHESQVVTKFANDDLRCRITFHAGAPRPMGALDVISKTWPIEADGQ